MPTDRSQKTRALMKASADNVMLAHKYSEKKHVFEDPQKKSQVDIREWLIFEKIDGIRATFDGNELKSRYGNKFYAPPEFIQIIKDSFGKRLDTNGLDGELVSSKGFQHTTSIVRDQTKKVSMEYWDDITYVVFDHSNIPLKPFRHRLEKLNSACTESNIVKILNPLATIISKDSLDLQLLKMINQSKEGLILRNPEAVYSVGRSWDLLKVKPFQDQEAEVIGYYDGEGKYAGMTGGLKCQFKDGTEFECGTGLTDEDRASPPAIGATVTIKYMGLTDAGKPRHPVYISIRDYE